MKTTITRRFAALLTGLALAACERAPDSATAGAAVRQRPRLASPHGGTAENDPRRQPRWAGQLPAWKNKRSEQKMQELVAYIKSLWSDPVYPLWWKLEQQSLEE